MTSDTLTPDSLHSPLFEHTRPPNNPKAFKRSSKPKRRLPRLSRRLVSVGVTGVAAVGSIGSSYSLTHARPNIPIPDRTQKLKDARSEAAKEIEELKSSKDKEYAQFKKEVSGRSRLHYEDVEVQSLTQHLHRIESSSYSSVRLTTLARRNTILNTTTSGGTNFQGGR